MLGQFKTWELFYLEYSVWYFLMQALKRGLRVGAGLLCVCVLVGNGSWPHVTQSSLEKAAPFQRVLVDSLLGGGTREAARERGRVGWRAGEGGGKGGGRCREHAVLGGELWVWAGRGGPAERSASSADKLRAGI